MNKYYRVDPFHPDNILRKKVPKDIITIDDIMTYEEYEASSYYKDFVFPLGIPYYHLVIYIYHKNTIIGGITLLKAKSEGTFTNCEISILKKVVPFIAKITVDNFLQDSLQAKEILYETLCNQSPSGFMAFDAQYPQVVNYINSSAQRYISEIMYNKAIQNPVYQFIADHILPESGFEHFGFSKIIQSRSMKQFYLNVSPNLFKNKPLVYVYIIPLDNAPNNKISINIHDCEDLTPRQKEIISCVLKGYTNEEIAEKLFISVSTVKTHLNAIYKKLNLPNRLSLCSKLSGNNEIFV
jgi:DNA-binding CsgD family transcriptional regulator